MKKNVIFVHEKFSHVTTKNFFQNPPKNISFIISNSSKQQYEKNFNQGYKTIKIIHIRRVLKKILNIFNLPRVIPVFPSKSKEFDYILSNFSLVLSTKKVILGPIEHLGDIVSYKYNKLNSPLAIKFLRTYVLSSRCKYVFFMSDSAKESFCKFLKIPHKKLSKFHAIYPIMTPLPPKKETRDSEVTLLYIARLRKINPEYSFYVKGGHLIIKTFKYLKKKYSYLKLIFVGYIPPEYQKELEFLKDIECYIKGYEGDIMDLFQKADIFLFPSYIDGYGFTIIEAMANSLPVVCLNNNFAATDLVLNNETGFIVDTPLKYLRFPLKIFHPDWIQKRRFYDYIKEDDDNTTLQEFISKVEILVQDNDLRKQFGDNGRKRLVNGKLSFSYRNKKLENLFN